MGDIKVEEVKNGLEPVYTPLPLTKHSLETADPDAETDLDNRNLVNYVIINHI